MYVNIWCGCVRVVCVCWLGGGGCLEFGGIVRCCGENVIVCGGMGVLLLIDSVDEKLWMDGD